MNFCADIGGHQSDIQQIGNIATYITVVICNMYVENCDGVYLCNFTMTFHDVLTVAYTPIKST